LLMITIWILELKLLNIWQKKIGKKKLKLLRNNLFNTYIIFCGQKSYFLHVRH
jgi:hypothetical protein